MLRGVIESGARRQQKAEAGDANRTPYRNREAPADCNGRASEGTRLRIRGEDAEGARQNDTVRRHVGGEGR